MMTLKELEIISLDWKVPFGVVLLYNIYVVRENARLEGAKPFNRSLLSWLTLMMTFYNMALCIFSLIVFRCTSRIIIQEFKSSTLEDFLCDTGRSIYEKTKYFNWVFYMSKFFEIPDTVILHLNNRKSSFLQMFHHTGVIICCWLLCISKTHVAWVFVVFNSFVHTFMYLYYTLACLKIKLWFKRWITVLQMTQFVSGSVLCLIHGFKREVYSSDPYICKLQVLALVMNISFVTILYILFSQFSRRTYKEKVN